MNRIEEKFGGNLITRIIEKFPYPEKRCRFCTQSMRLVTAAHIQGEEELYKALYYCDNVTCPAYEEEQAMQYAKVYYSCEEAVNRLESYRIIFPMRMNSETRR